MSDASPRAAGPFRARHADLAQRVSGLQLEARRLTAGLIAGLHRSIQRGGSSEFAEYAEYSPGDDPRTIDWKSVAKTDRYFVKRFEETTNRRCYLLLDSSASMAFARGGRPSKLEVARVVLAALSSLLLRQGDSVGVSVLRDGEEAGHAPARARGGHLDVVLSALAEAEPSGVTRLAAALDAAGAGMPRRSLVVLASDLVDDLEEVGAALRRLAARGHEIVVLHVLESDELTFPFVGVLRFKDPETGEEVTAEPSAVVEGYRKELAAFLSDCDRACDGARADMVRLSNADDLARPLLTFLARRQGLVRRLVAAR